MVGKRSAPGDNSCKGSGVNRVLVAAILVIGDDTWEAGACNSLGGELIEGPENCEGSPIVCLDVLGQTILQRVIADLRHAGIGEITLVADDSLAGLVHTLPVRTLEISLVHRPTSAWLAVGRTLHEYARNGISSVLLMRLGAYVEVEFSDLLDFHHARVETVTRAYDRHGRLDLWLINPQECFEYQLPFDPWPAAEEEFPVDSYFVGGYVNRLRDGRDYRRLVVDALLSRCSIRPQGSEVKPGVWAGEGAKVHRGSRIVAPAFIGAKTRIEDGTLITRCSAIESGCRVDYGTVIEDSSLLPETCVGADLDVCHSLVCRNHVLDLRRNVVVEVDDPSLIDSAQSHLWTDGNSVGFPLRGSLHHLRYRGQRAFASPQSS